MSTSAVTKMPADALATDTKPNTRDECCKGYEIRRTTCGNTEDTGNEQRDVKGEPSPNNIGKDASEACAKYQAGK